MNELKEDSNPQSGKFMYGNVDYGNVSLPCWCGASVTPNQEGINWCFPRGLNVNSSALGKIHGCLLDPDFLWAKLHPRNKRRYSQLSNSQQWPVEADKRHFHRRN